MSSSSWGRLGEGFSSGDRKGQHKISTRNVDTHVSVRKTTQQKRDDSEPEKKPQVTKTKWKGSDILSSFSLPAQNVPNSPQSNDISWSASSSEDEVSGEENKKAQIKISHERERKRRVGNKSIAKANKHKRRSVDLTFSSNFKNLISKSDMEIGEETQSCIKTEGGGVVKDSSSRGQLGVDEEKKIVSDFNANRLNISTFEGRDVSKNLKKVCNSNEISNYNKFEGVGIGEQNKRVRPVTSEWNISTFDVVSKNESTEHRKKSRNFRKRGNNISRAGMFEDVDIDESGSSSESVNGDEVDRGEDLVRESDVEDIASDESEGSMQLTKMSQTNSLAASQGQGLSGDRGSQQIEINSVKSSIDSCSPSSQKVGASDWAVRFQQEVREVSPDSNDRQSMVDVNLMDSAKKKKKFSSKGLTGQLSRLINREKSAMRFWQHSSSKGTLNENDRKSVHLEIVWMCRQFSLYLAQCRVVSDSDSLLPSRRCQLMLVRSHVEKMGLQSGNTIQLFPPWKQMDEGEKITILCSNQVRVVSPITKAGSDHSMVSTTTSVPGSVFASTSAVCPTSSDIQTADVEDKEELTQITYRWNCPCKLDKSMHSTKCPAYHSDHYIKYFSQMALLDKTSPLPHPTTTPLHLHSVQSSTFPPSSSSTSPSSHHPPPSPIHRTIQQSIQEERTGPDCMPPFVATVLRVFRQNVSSSDSVCLSVLLEDASGTLALVQHEEVDMASHHSWWSELFQMEGKQCVCQGLSMLTRRNKDKDLSLFQVIDTAWKGGKPVNVDSQDDSQIGPTTRKIPTFCYILQCIGDVRGCVQPIGTEMKDGLALTGLKHAVGEMSRHRRFSCVARMIDVWDSLVESSEAKGLFVCDVTSHNGDDDNQRVMTFTTFYPLCLGKGCVALERQRDRKSHVYLLHNVVWNRDSIEADGYSTILSQSVWCHLGVDKRLDLPLLDALTGHVIKVPLLSQSSVSDSFVRVSGHVVHINEDKCYSWEGCGDCGTELVTEDHTGAAECPECHKPVTDADTRLTMEVQILEDSCKDQIVRIDLTQNTISSLLPDEVPNEGYDMDLVLGRSLTAVAYVVNRTSQAIQLYQVDL